MRRLILKAAIKAEQLSTERLCEAKTQGHGSQPGRSLWGVRSAGTQERVGNCSSIEHYSIRKSHLKTVLRLKTTPRIFCSSPFSHLLCSGVVESLL